jgi:outer membrane protein assembly factor BamB
VLGVGTVYASGESRIYAVDMKTGRNRWSPVEVRRMQEGRMKEVKVSNVVASGGLVIGITPVGIMALDQASGQLAWELPGTYNPERASLAVAGNVLYFQGSPEARPAARSTGTLHAIDLDTRAILWSFTRPTEDPNWSFGTVTPVDGGLWTDTYRTLLKLE